MSIEFATANESFKRAMHEVLSFYFSDGTTIAIGGSPKTFIKSRIEFTLENFYEDSDNDGTLVDEETNPIIVFAGERTGGWQYQKCESEIAGKPFQLQKWCEVKRQVFIAGRRNVTGESGLRNSRRLMDRVWDQLQYLIESQVDAFSARGIYFPQLDPFPVEGKDDKFIVNTGSFECQVRFDVFREERDV